LLIQQDKTSRRGPSGPRLVCLYPTSTEIITLEQVTPPPDESSVMTTRTIFYTSDIYDAAENEVASLDLQLESLGAHRQFHGRIRTVSCLHDNGLVKAIANEPGNNQVLVVDGGGSLHSALMGGNIATAFADNGWAGVIINGAIRDRHEIEALQMGVKALGSNPRKSAKQGTGERDVPVTIHNVEFVPGAMVYADEDGVIVDARDIQQI